MDKTHFFSGLPSPKKTLSLLKRPKAIAIVICDKSLRPCPLLKSWLDAPSFRFYFARGGEESKSAERLPYHLKRVLSLTKGLPPEDLIFISLGGGSIGDLTGFLASIYKRGAPLAHVPATWLAALDSAHGGKTALNFQGAKNIAGSYHFPEAVFISRELLKGAPPAHILSAFGELLKISLVSGGELYKELKCVLCRAQAQAAAPPPPKRGGVKSRAGGSQPLPDLLPQNIERALRALLKKAIAAKMRIVRADPCEKKSIRRRLNLGHTAGHIMEAAWGIPHGIAVLHGLLFSLKWSLEKGFLSEALFKETAAFIPPAALSFGQGFGQKSPKQPRRAGGQKPALGIKEFKRLLRQDKKRVSPLMWDFLFVRRPGLVFARPVSEEELLSEARRQGIVRGRLKRAGVRAGKHALK